MTTKFVRLILSLLLLLSLTLGVSAQTRHEIHFPDLPDRVTLACDLHMHTVFSDGQVWPTTRVSEAWRQGLDVISITDHIEYQPHKTDVPTNHNRPYDLAKGSASTSGTMLLRGTEITRDTPPGHFNAIFLDDVNPLDTEDFVEAVGQANQQDAFVFWNHQGWKGEEKGRWLDVHTRLFENGQFQGMEVCNGGSYYPTAHKWCMEKNLTMLGNSDIHKPCLITDSTANNHRTITLVFAKEKTPEAVKEALLAGRTAVWFKDQLIGREEMLRPLFDGMVQIDPPNAWSSKSIWVQLRNTSDADIQLERTGTVGPAEIELTARATTLIQIKGAGDVDSLKLEYTATNLLIAPETGLPVVLDIAKNAR